MTFINLRSQSGADALKRALEAPSVTRVANGKLTVDDALGMEEREALSAFQLIRWADTKGLPKCRKCGSTDTYEIRRSAFRCQHCDHEFSVTSNTMLHGRKLGLAKYLAVLSLILDKEQFRSLLQFSQQTGIGYKTVWDQTNHFRLCAKDTNGCTVPFAILTRDAWRARVAQIRTNLGRFMVRPKDQRYPYLSEQNREVDGAELLALVNKWVPQWVPDHLRSDICQDMIVTILSGEATRDQVHAHSKKYLSAKFAEFPWKYKWVSFDAPLRDDDDRSLHDIFDADRIADHYQRVHR